MRDARLDDAKPKAGRHRRDEAVHAAELEREREGHLATHDAERAPGVADVIAKKPAPEKAPDDAPGASDEGVGSRMGAITLHEIRAMAFEFNEKGGDVARVVLKIGVEDRKDAPAAGAEPGVEGRGLPVPPAGGRAGHGDAAEPGASGHLGADGVACAVGRPVVDDEKLKGAPQGEHGVPDLLDQARDVLSLVVGWRHHRQLDLSGQPSRVLHGER